VSQWQLPPVGAALLRHRVLDLLSLMTLAELHQRRVGDASALLGPTTAAGEELVRAWRSSTAEARESVNVPAWMRAYLEERMTEEESGLRVYYEGGTRDRHWVAPVGLSLSESYKQRVSKPYKTKWHAQQALARIEERTRRAT
jgi:hypothetical protein